MAKYMMESVICVTLVLVYQLGIAYSYVACPSGDQSGIVSGGQTCAELVATNINNCYDVETQCCASCNAVNTNVTGCEFRDRTLCYSFLCGTSSDPADCCYTCPAFTVAQTAATTTTTAPTTAAPATAAPATTTSTVATESTPSKNNDCPECDIVGYTFGGIAFLLIVGIIGIIIYKSKAFKPTVDVEKTATSSNNKNTDDVTSISSNRKDSSEKIPEINGNLTSHLRLNSHPLPPITTSPVK